MISSKTSYNRLIAYTGLAVGGGNILDISALESRVTEAESRLDAIDTLIASILVSITNIIAEPTPIQTGVGNPNELGRVGAYDGQLYVNLDGSGMKYNWVALVEQWI